MSISFQGYLKVHYTNPSEKPIAASNFFVTRIRVINYY